jgi:hypothetical protein
MGLAQVTPVAGIAEIAFVVELSGSDELQPPAFGVGMLNDASRCGRWYRGSDVVHDQGTRQRGYSEGLQPPG